jgi:hypothetical protein
VWFHCVLTADAQLMSTLSAAKNDWATSVDRYGPASWFGVVSVVLAERAVRTTGMLTAERP